MPIGIVTVCITKIVVPKKSIVLLNLEGIVFTPSHYSYSVALFFFYGLGKELFQAIKQVT